MTTPIGRASSSYRPTLIEGQVLASPIGGGLTAPRYLADMVEETNGNSFVLDADSSRRWRITSDGYDFRIENFDTSNWNIISQASNYGSEYIFWSFLGVGSFSYNAGTTDDIQNLLTLTANKNGGNVGPGFGLSITFQAEDSISEYSSMSKIASVWEVATRELRSSKIVFYRMSSGVEEEVLSLGESGLTVDGINITGVKNNNLIFASPDSSSGIPSWRALVAADIPTLTLSKISDVGTMASQNANAVTITGGAINGTTIGATTASTGVFTVTSISPAIDTDGLIIRGVSGHSTNLLRFNRGSDNAFIGGFKEVASGTERGLQLSLEGHIGTGSASFLKCVTQTGNIEFAVSPSSGIRMDLKIGASTINFSGNTVSLGSVIHSGGAIFSGGTTYTTNLSTSNQVFSIKGDNVNNAATWPVTAIEINTDKNVPSNRFFKQYFPFWNIVTSLGTTSEIYDGFSVEATHSSGTANGFGTSIKINLKSSTTAAQNAARIVALWNDATHASRKADLVLSAYDASSEREGLRIRGNGSAAAIGFLGATPVIRQSLSNIYTTKQALSNLGLATNGNCCVSTSINYTATTADSFILVNALSGEITISLPVASSVSGIVYTIKKSDVSTNAVIIDGHAGDLIDGLPTYTLISQYEKVNIISNGSDWYVI